MSAQSPGREHGKTGERTVRHICLTPTKTQTLPRHSGESRNPFSPSPFRLLLRMALFPGREERTRTQKRKTNPLDSASGRRAITRSWPPRPVKSQNGFRSIPPSSVGTDAGMTNKPARAVGTGLRACPRRLRGRHPPYGRARSNFPLREVRRPYVSIPGVIATPVVGVAYMRPGFFHPPQGPHICGPYINRRLPSHVKFSFIRTFSSPSNDGGILKSHTHITHLTSSITSSSTGAPRGSSATPTATLACKPLSPKISAARLDAPFTTRGWAVKSGATAT